MSVPLHGRTTVPNGQRLGSGGKAQPRVVIAWSMWQRGQQLGRGNDSSGGGLLLGGNKQDNRQPQKLVLPGDRGSARPGAKLLVPEKGMEKILKEGADALGPELVTPTGPNRYRPPAGFMDDNVQEDQQLAAMSPDDMISRLRSRAGRWFNLAKMFPYLAQAGYDSNSVDELTGLTPAQQNAWAVAATVYDSLEASGRVPEEVLEKFHGDGDALLYPFRFLNQEMRVEAALYVVANNFDVAACDVLARSMKEWERRPSERAGFSNLPGDCLAYKYMRDALECRAVEEAQLKVQQALATAVTEEASARLAQVLSMLRGEEGVGAGKTGIASLTVLRLDPDDLGFRPIPMLGSLGLVTAEHVASAPRTAQEGAFGAFSIEGPGSGCKWVALPQWKALAMMSHPVALLVPDCASVPAVVSGIRVKTDDDKRRLAGSGMLLAEKQDLRAEDADESSFYLTPVGHSGQLALVEGTQLKAQGLPSVATVVFIARPPAREQPATPGDSLLQL